MLVHQYRVFINPLNVRHLLKAAELGIIGQSSHSPDQVSETFKIVKLDTNKKLMELTCTSLEFLLPCQLEIEHKWLSPNQLSYCQHTEKNQINIF